MEKAIQIFNSFEDAEAAEISRENLILNKEAAGRPKDLDDAGELRKRTR